MSRPSTIVISDWLANFRSNQWTPFEAGTALKAALAKEGYVIVDSEPAAYRWRWKQSSSKRWTIRAFGLPPEDTISEPLYAVASDRPVRHEETVK